MPRIRERDRELPLYVSYFYDTSRGMEGYRVRHAPSGQSYSIASGQLTLERKLEIALEWLKQAEEEHAIKPQKFYRERELPKNISVQHRVGRQSRYRVDVPGKPKRSFTNIRDAIDLKCEYLCEKHVLQYGPHPDQGDEASIIIGVSS